MAKIEHRAKIEQLIYKVMTALDPTGSNTKRYKDLLHSMTDAQFTRWMNKFLAEEDYNFTLEVTPFEGHPDLSLDDIKAAADILGVPLDEYLYMPFLHPDGPTIASRDPTPVGYVRLRRLEQILSKKNAYSSEITQRDAKTGRILGSYKNILIA